MESPEQPFPEEFEARVRGGLELVRAIAIVVRRQLGGFVAIEELMACGNEGLVLAARTFRPEFDVPFKNWAGIKIRGAMIDGASHSTDRSRRFQQRLRGLVVAQEATVALAEKPLAHMDAEGADAALDQELSSMATAMALKLGANLRDEQKAFASPTQEDELLEKELHQRLRTIAKELPEGERHFIQRMYFDSDEPNIADVGRELGLSKSWSCRVHARAVARMTELLQA